LVKQLVARLEKDVQEMGDASAVTPELIAHLKGATVPEVLH